MSYLIDDVARILAGPTPRRKALKLIGGVLAGSVFGTMFGQVGGGVGDPTACPPATPAGGTTSGCADPKKCCGQVCVGQGIGSPGSANCCPNTFACPPTRCCKANGTFGCCPPGTCGKNTSIGSSDTCVPVGGATPTGCTTNTALCG